MRYQVGSLCVIVEAPAYPHFVGKECTVVGPFKVWSDGYEAYEVEIQGESGSWRAQSCEIKLKRFPPAEDAWCREKVKDLLKPVDVPKHEEDLV